MPVKIFTDSLHKIAYSTDASVYREVPAGVAFPDTVDEIKHHLDEARLRHTHIIPRAGGTSLAGQVVGEGIVADISRHWCHILEINAQERWARVEPGVVRDELNRALKPLGLGKCSAANEGGMARRSLIRQNSNEFDFALISLRECQWQSAAIPLCGTQKAWACL